MESSTILVILIIAGLVTLVPAVAKLITTSDHRHINQYFKSRGLTILHLEWLPFRRADMGENMLRVYDVICKDAADAIHHYLVKVAWLAASDICIEELT